jgi:hypothetical protein
MPQTQLPPLQTGFRFRRRVVIGFAYALWLGVLCWGGTKLFWWWQYGVAVTDRPGVDTVWQTFYPEIDASGVLEAKLSPSDGFYDVLLLGGSVLEQTAPVVDSALRAELGNAVRLFNLARAAHTSRDSYLKFTRFGDRHFDLVIFYDGINDARMNCCPDSVFRPDYSHFGWYCVFRQRLEAGGMTVSDIVKKSLAGMHDFPSDFEQWQSYGEKVKTVEPYRKNLEPIIAAAEQRHCPIALMTFAYHIPPGYSDEAFLEKRLDYGPGQYGSTIRTWGTPQGVRAAIDAHNGVIRELAGRYKNVILIDQQAAMPPNGKNFSDACHLTTEGIDVFVRHLMDSIRPELKRWSAGSRP